MESNKKKALFFRFKASGLHLLGSATVISIFLWMVYFFWYPHPFQILFSTRDVVQVLIGVDLVLGPLLTFIIFNIAKPRRELVLDLGIILLVQVFALLWGGYVTFSARPQFVVFSNGELYAVTQNEIDMSMIPESLEARSVFGPPATVYARNPATREEYDQYIQDLSSGKVPIAMEQPQRYEAYNLHRSEISINAQSLDDFSTTSSTASEWVELSRKKWGSIYTEMGVFRVSAGKVPYKVLVNLDDGRLLDVYIHDEAARK